MAVAFRRVAWLRLGRPDGENAVKSAGHGATFDLLYVPVVGQARPAEDGLDARGPDVARLDSLDSTEGEHVGEVHEPELVLVHLQPRVSVLAANVVHRLGERLDDSRQLALAPRDQAPCPSHAVPTFGEPAL